MFAKSYLFIFLLSINIYAELGLQNELSQLKSASESVELSQWTDITAAKKKKKKERYVTEDSIGLKSSGLKKEVAIPPKEEGIGKIRYRSR